MPRKRARLKGIGGHYGLRKILSVFLRVMLFIVILIGPKILESDKNYGTGLKTRPSRSQNVKKISNWWSGTGLMNCSKIC